MQVKRLLDVWTSGGNEESRAARKGLEENIDSYPAGELEHDAEAISCVWEFSNKEGPFLHDPSGPASSSKRSSKVSANIMKFTGCDLRPRLVKSIKEGYLLDRKYWVKRSRKGDVEPIYFSSGVVWVDLDAGESLFVRVIEATELCSVRTPLGVQGSPQSERRRRRYGKQ